MVCRHIYVWVCMWVSHVLTHICISKDLIHVCGSVVDMCVYVG